MSTLATLPLYKIESELLELLALAEEHDLDPEAKEAVEKQISDYFSAEVRKVDGIAGAIHRCDSALAEIGEEIRRLRKIEDAWEARMDRIKACTLRAMQDHGIRVLETATNKLTVCGNGGKQPLYVDPERESDEYCDVTVTLPLTVWCEMVKAAVQSQVITEGYAGALNSGTVVAPNNELIRQALSRGQAVPGASLLPRGEHLRVK